MEEDEEIRKFREALQDLYDRRDPALSPTLRKAWEQGWSAAVLGNMIGMLRQTARARIRAVRPESYDHPEIPDIPPASKVAANERRVGKRKLKPRPVIDYETGRRLRRLQASATKVRSNTQPGSSNARASNQLNKLIDQLRKKGLSVRKIALAMGVSPSGLMHRLARYGYPASPSVIKYEQERQLKYLANRQGKSRETHPARS